MPEAGANLWPERSLTNENGVNLADEVSSTTQRLSREAGSG